MKVSYYHGRPIVTIEEKIQCRNADVAEALTKDFVKIVKKYLKNKLIKEVDICEHCKNLTIREI